MLGPCLFVVHLGHTRIPPSEATLLQNFKQHRATFEQLRDMLASDTNLNRIGTWGVNLQKPHFVGRPDSQLIPPERYERYRILLKEVSANMAARDIGNPSEIELTIFLWSWGAAVSPRHYNMGICWREQEPTKQVSTLDGYPSHSEPGNAYRHIDSHWYIWTDL